MSENGSDDSIEYLSEWPITAANDADDRDDEDDVDEGDECASRLQPLTRPRPSLARRFDFPAAETALAAWHRSRPRPPTIAAAQDGARRRSVNPRTALNALRRTDPAAEEFMRAKVQQLRNAGDDKVLASPRYHYILATYLDGERSFSSALASVERSLKLLRVDVEALRRATTTDFLDALNDIDEEAKDCLWLYEKLRLQVCASAAVGAAAAAAAAKRGPFAVDRRAADDLSDEEFREKYANARRPVVITGLAARLLSGDSASGADSSLSDGAAAERRWTMAHVRRVAGHRTAKLMARQPFSSEWAGLEPVEAASMTVAEFIDGILSGSERAKDLYLFDWSLPLFCPELNREISPPRYVRDDFLKRTSPASLYRDSWPSLFVAPAGANGGLHVDAFASNFWMALFEGRKRWIFYPPEDLPLLSPTYHDSLDPVFDSSDAAGASAVQRAEVLLEAGEVLFVPSGCPHRVENVTASVAVSGNFVDASNADRVETALRRDAIRNPRAAELLRQFVEKGFI